jgi:hypothetical protein
MSTDWQRRLVWVATAAALLLLYGIIIERMLP